MSLFFEVNETIHRGLNGLDNLGAGPIVVATCMSLAVKRAGDTPQAQIIGDI